MTSVNTSNVTWDQAAYDALTYAPFRSELLFDMVADVRPTNQTMPGTSVIFDQYTDISAQTTALTETTDPAAVALTQSQVTVTLAEYGASIGTTRLLQATSYIPVDPVLADAIGRNAGLSIDTIARNVLIAGTNVAYSGAATSRGTVASTHNIVGNDVRRQVAALRSANVPTVDGTFYMGAIAPDISFDLRSQTGAGAWRTPREYIDASEILRGEVGSFEGVRFVETSRLGVLGVDALPSGFVNGGVGSTVDVYPTMIVGKQSLAKAFTTLVGDQPQTVVSPVVDRLRRFVHMGWYWIGGYNRFRESAIRRIESASSIGANS